MDSNNACRIRWLCASFAVLYLSACSHLPAKKNTALESYQLALKDIATKLNSDAGNADVKNNYLLSLPPGIDSFIKPESDERIPDRAKVDMARRFNVKANNVPIKTFLISLVESTELNIVPYPELSGNITLDLKDVTIVDVLSTLANSYGLDYSVRGNNYEVFKPRLRSKIFHIDYLNIERYGKSQVKISSGQISEVRNNAAANKKPGKSKRLAPNRKTNSLSGTEVSTISRNQFWRELRDSIKVIIGDNQNNTIVVNAHSGAIIVRAMPSELRNVERFLKLTQTIISRQVLLEAKIIEVVLSENYQTGINWSGLVNSGNNSLLLSQTGGGSTFAASGISEIAGNQGDLNPQNFTAVNGSLASAFGGVFSIALKTQKFSTFIEALETQGDVHVLSSPRVSTINNQKAIIKVGSDEFFVTGVSTQTVTNVNTNTSVNVEITPFFSGVALDVTPQINANGRVTLHVHPSVSNVREKIKKIAVSSTDTLELPLALSSIRESDSIVQANSGQVIVIGGLMQSSIDDNSASVPILSDLPIVGALFRHEKNSRRKSELVILLRPIVIRDDKQWDSVISSDFTGNLNRK